MKVRCIKMRASTGPRVQNLDETAMSVYLSIMTRIVDIEDRARLPWRFYGASRSALARL
ncbi:MAG: hypothetical protein AAGB07_02930 [Pseudomonadota bacterium]